MENIHLIGLSRQMTLERQIDVVANNVANANTTGFKADKSVFQEFLGSSARDGNFGNRDSRVSYVQDSATFRDFSQGPSEQTKNPLDIAIDGNAFFVVQTAGGDRYTRDGGLQINARGQLVSVAGNPVLGTSGPIVFQPGDRDITIAGDGGITVREGNSRTDSVRGKLRLVNFTQPQKLQKDGSNLFAAGDAGAALPSTTSTVKQGFIEKSNVNSVTEMSRMIEVTRAYTQISAMLQQQGDLRKSALDKLADVPA